MNGHYFSPPKIESNTLIEAYLSLEAGFGTCLAVRHPEHPARNLTDYAMECCCFEKPSVRLFLSVHKRF
jgi:hypothetical protein